MLSPGSCAGPALETLLLSRISRQQRFMCLVMEMLGKSLDDTLSQRLRYFWEEAVKP